MGFICQHTRRMILVNFGLVFGFPVWQNVNHLLFLLIFYSKRVQRLTTTCVRSPQSTDILYSFQYHNHLAIAPPVLVYDCFTSKFVLGKLRQPSSCLNFIYQQFFPRTLAHNLPRTSSSSPHEMFRICNRLSKAASFLDLSTNARCHQRYRPTTTSLAHGTCLF